MSGTRVFSTVVQQGKKEDWYSKHAPEIDYADWARQRTWSTEQTVALSFGLDPYSIDWNRLQATAESSELAREIIRFKKRVEDAQWDEIVLPMRPHLFVDWIVVRGYEVPKALVEAVEAWGRPLTFWKDRCEQLASELEQLRASSGRGKGISPKGEASLLKMILGMAIRKYGFRPGLERQGSTVSRIRDDLRTVGIDIDDQPILDWLRRAAAEVERNTG